MIPDRDVWAAATLMVKRYGDDAAIQAAMRADELGKANDIDGQCEWIRILKAIEQLQRQPAPGEPVN
jgi:hypothetical protein